MTIALQVIDAYKTFSEVDDEQQRSWWKVWQKAGQGLFAVTYGMIRTAVILGITVLWFDLDMSQANVLGGFVVLAVASVSFLGLGLVAAVLPLLSPERGPQATHIIQGLLLLCSSVYYQVTVLPGWLQPLANLNPATFALDAIRATWIGGANLADVWPSMLTTDADRRHFGADRADDLSGRRAVCTEDGEIEAQRLRPAHTPEEFNRV